MTSLFTQKKKDFCMYLFREDNTHILNFAKHTYSKSIADLLLLILRCDNMASGLNRYNVEKVWAKKVQILQILIENLQSSEQNKLNEYCMNIPEILNTLVKCDEWLLHLSSQEIVNTLIKISCEKTPSGCACLSILANMTGFLPTFINK